MTLMTENKYTEVESRTGPCVVCGEEGPILDTLGYTKWNLESADGKKEYWYCPAHAEQYLWKFIDTKSGNTMDAILTDMKKDGMM